MPLKKHKHSKLIDAWGQQRRTAGCRGIAFHLTFEQWLRLWTASGHLHERGRRRGQYVMARFKDKGAYEIGNVRIITCSENHAEADPSCFGIPKTEEHKAKLRAARLGTKAPLETRLKLSLMKKGKPLGPMKESTKQKLSIFRKGVPTGRKPSPETLVKMEIGRQRYWANWRLAKGSS